MKPVKEILFRFGGTKCRSSLNLSFGCPKLKVNLEYKIRQLVYFQAEGSKPGIFKCSTTAHIIIIVHSIIIVHAQ